MPRYSALIFSVVTSAAFALMSALLGCGSPGNGKQVTVRFERDGVSTADFYVEVVATPEERARGLMFRKSLEVDRGMLFVFPQEQQLAFWMKNTFISLDMIFVSSDWRVVGVLKNVPPLTEDRRSVNAPSQYVLEFAAGTAESHAIQPGTKVMVKGALPQSR